MASQTILTGLEDVPSTSAVHAVQHGPRKKPKQTTRRSTCLGDIELTCTMEMEAVSKTSNAVESAIQKDLPQEESLDPGKGRRLAIAAGKVAADLVAWGVVNRRHPSDDQAQPHMDTVYKALDSAMEGVRGLKLSRKQEAFVRALAVRLASLAIEEYLFQTHPDHAKLKAQREAAEEAFWKSVDEKQTGKGKEKEENWLG